MLEPLKLVPFGTDLQCILLKCIVAEVLPPPSPSNRCLGGCLSPLLLQTPRNRHLHGHVIRTVSCAMAAWAALLVCPLSPYLPDGCASPAPSYCDRAAGVPPATARRDTRAPRTSVWLRKTGGSRRGSRQILGRRVEHER